MRRVKIIIAARNHALTARAYVQALTPRRAACRVMVSFFQATPTVPSLALPILSFLRV
jgi:hypothetical protein